MNPYRRGACGDLRSHAIPDAVDVHREQPIPRFVVDVGHGHRRQVDARVVDRAIQATEFVHRELDQGPRVGRHRHVGPPADGPPARRAKGLRGRAARLVVEIADHDGEAVSGESRGDREADASRSARHDRYPAFNHESPPGCARPLRTPFDVTAAMSTRRERTPVGPNHLMSNCVPIVECRRIATAFRRRWQPPVANAMTVFAGVIAPESVAYTSPMDDACQLENNWV